MTLPILDLHVEPPAGTERIVALWSRGPKPFQLAQLLSLIEGELPSAHRTYRATRDIVRLRQSLEKLPAEDHHAVVLELEHYL